MNLRSGSPGLPITVVIPAYNRQDLVTRAIESAQAQRPLPPAEILVIDDASTDNTAAVAVRAGATVVRHARNLGEGGARNSGFERASQSWVALLDSDDEWLPGHLSTLWPRRANHVMVASSAVAVRDGRPEALLGPPTDAPLVLVSPPDLVLPENPIPASGVIVNRDLVRSLGGFRVLPRGADLDMWIRVIERGSVLACPEPGYLYHLHPGQVSTDRSAMRRDTNDLLMSYSDRDWFDPRLPAGVTAVGAWDDFRAATRARSLGAMVSNLRCLIRRPDQWLLLLHLKRGRASRRERLAAWSADHRSQEFQDSERRNA